MKDNGQEQFTWKDVPLPLPPAPGAPDLGLTCPKERIFNPLTALTK